MKLIQTLVRPAAIFVSLLLSGFSVSASPLEIDLSRPIPPARDCPVGPGATRNPQGNEISLDSRSLRMDGRPFIPIVGEFHFTRYPCSEWRDELLKMKAGGVEVVSSYVFWIHHEEERGKFDWNGNHSLRDFLKLCEEVGLKAIVRIGPWCHGEVRNGGFPDWVENSGTKLRSTNPKFLALVRPLYTEIAAQMKGLLWKDGGPVIAVQVENEKSDPGYLLALKKMAQDAGTDVPFFTMTGWNRVAIPEEGLLPLFGAYSDGFWGGTPEKYRKSFLFSPVRDDGDLGAQMENVRPERNERMELFPFACAEIGGGMMSSYEKRIKVDPDDIAAMALVKLGCGNNMPGYYMYHGGINPDGKLSTLQEEKPNAMPVKDYDFQTALGAAGQVREQFHLLREQHLFLEDFGGQLAEMPAFFPTKQPEGLSDFDTLRWSMRADAEGRGFLFFNNHQPAVPMPAKSDVQFAIEGRSGEMLVPTKPVTIPSGAYGIWPIRLDCDGVLLDYATAQPLCRVEGDDGTIVYFLVAIEGVRPELALAGRAPQIAEPGSKPATVVKNDRGTSVAFVVLTPGQGEDFYRAPFGGRSKAILSNATVVADRGDLRLMADRASDFEIAFFPAPAEVKLGDMALSGARDGIFTRFTLDVPTPPAVNVTAELEKPAGPMAASLQGTDEKAWADAAVYRLIVPPHAMDRRLRLDIDYVGDAARVYAGDRLILDDFYNGSPFALPLWRVPTIDWSKLTLKVLPYSDELAVRLPKTAREKATAAQAAGSLNAVTITSVEPLEASISPRSHELPDAGSGGRRSNLP